MMSEKQYRVARKGIVEQIKLAQKLHCVNLEKKHKAALKKLELRFLKPDATGCFDWGGQEYRVVVIIYKLSRLWRERLEKPLNLKVRLIR